MASYQYYLRKAKAETFSRIVLAYVTFSMFVTSCYEYVLSTCAKVVTSLMFKTSLDFNPRKITILYAGLSRDPLANGHHTLMEIQDETETFTNEMKYFNAFYNQDVENFYDYKRILNKPHRHVYMIYMTSDYKIQAQYINIDNKYEWEVTEFNFTH